MGTPLPSRVKDIVRRVVRPIRGRRLEALWLLAQRMGAHADVVRRDWALESDDYIRASWEQRHLPRFELVRDAVLAGDPDSILDVGCGAGNIAAILAEKTRVRIDGFDLHPGVQLSRPWLLEAGLTNVHLYRADLTTALPQIADASFHTAFSACVLMYLHPSAIERALAQLVRIARARVVLLDLHADNPWLPRGVFFPPGNWKRDYFRLFRRLGLPEGCASIEPVPEAIWAPSGGGGSLICVDVARWRPAPSGR